MEPWEVQTEAQISQFWKVEGPQTSLLKTCPTDSSRFLYRRKVPIKAETYETLAFPLPQAPRREGSCFHKEK